MKSLICHIKYEDWFCPVSCRTGKARFFLLIKYNLYSPFAMVDMGVGKFFTDMDSKNGDA